MLFMKPKAKGRERERIAHDRIMVLVMKNAQMKNEIKVFAEKRPQFVIQGKRSD